MQQAVDWACGLGQQILGHIDDAAVSLAQHILIEPTACRPSLAACSGCCSCRYLQHVAAAAAAAAAATAACSMTELPAHQPSVRLISTRQEHEIRFWMYMNHHEIVWLQCQRRVAQQRLAATLRSRAMQAGACLQQPSLWQLLRRPGRHMSGQRPL